MCFSRTIWYLSTWSRNCCSGPLFAQIVLTDLDFVGALFLFGQLLCQRHAHGSSELVTLECTLGDKWSSHNFSVRGLRVLLPKHLPVAGSSAASLSSVELAPWRHLFCIVARRTTHSVLIGLSMFPTYWVCRIEIIM